MVGGLEHERHPADAALDRHELQVGEAREHAARDEVDALQPVLQEHLARRVRVGRRGAVARDALGPERRRHLAAADVEVDREPGLLRDRPQRVPVRLAEVGQPEALRFTGEEDAAVARVEVALDLLDRLVDVPERHGHDREQPACVGRRPVAQEVVVRAHAHELELVVADAEEALAAEAGDVRVEHLRPDADLVHVPRGGRRRRTTAGWHSS